MTSSRLRDQCDTVGSNSIHKKWRLKSYEYRDIVLEDKDRVRWRRLDNWHGEVSCDILKKEQ